MRHSPQDSGKLDHRDANSGHNRQRRGGRRPAKLAGGRQKSLTVGFALVVALTLVVAACSNVVQDLQVAAPTFSLEPGEHAADIEVELSTTTENASIYYTTDGSDPTVSGDLYGGPISVTGNGTTADIRAYADAEGLQPSGTVRGVFEIVYDALPTPVFTPEGGTPGGPASFSTAQEVSISVPDHNDASVYYNINGGGASETDSEYDSPIILDRNGEFTINVLAVKDGFADVEASATYALNLGRVSEPTFQTPDGMQLITGSYARDLEVEIVSETEGATIHYTVAEGSSAPIPTPGGSETSVYDGSTISLTGDGAKKTIRALATAQGRGDSVVAGITLGVDWPTLELQANGNGSVEIAALGTAGPATVEYGTATAIAASASGAYTFNSWSIVTGNPDAIDIADPNSPTTTVTLHAIDAVIAANFTNEAPAAPTGLSGTAADSSTIELSWQDNSDNETGFEIQRKPLTSGSFEEVFIAGAEATTFEDHGGTGGLEADTTYEYRIRAVNGAGTSAWSNEVSVTTDPVYPITYNGNGADSGQPPTDAVGMYDEGASVTVLGNTDGLVKADHTFAGWNTQPDRSGVGYAPGDPLTMPADDVTLYAVWNPDYAVTIDFQNPEDPDVSFSDPEESVTRGAQFDVGEASNSYLYYDWYLDGDPGHGALSGSCPVVTVDTAGLGYGTHTVTLVVDETYSADFSFDVVN